MKEYIQKILEGEHLTADEARGAMLAIMEGNATEAQIGAFLVAEKMKGEHVDELTAFAQVMREKSLKVNLNGTVAVDMCGTGGDGSGTFNISTAASFVVAGADVAVAKHGNRSISSKCGSADVLKQLGVNIALQPEQVERCLNEVGIGFLFAPTFHPAMKHAAKPRSELGVKTLFNMMGPMTNPAGVERQLVGAFSMAAAEKMAQVFSKLGARRVLVVHSEDGIDEISISGRTHVFEVAGENPIKKYTIAPEDFGFSSIDLSELKGGEAEVNAEIFKGIFGGGAGPRADVVTLNAGFGLYASGRAATPEDGLAMAAESIGSGSAYRKLNELVEASNSY
jgi:anthranilate phosphoribosyltransferase